MGGRLSQAGILVQPKPRCVQKRPPRLNEALSQDLIDWVPGIKGLGLPARVFVQKYHQSTRENLNEERRQEDSEWAQGLIMHKWGVLLSSIDKPDNDIDNNDKDLHDDQKQGGKGDYGDGNIGSMT